MSLQLCWANGGLFGTIHALRHIRAAWPRCSTLARRCAPAPRAAAPAHTRSQVDASALPNFLQPLPPDRLSCKLHDFEEKHMFSAAPRPPPLTALAADDFSASSRSSQGALPEEARHCLLQLHQGLRQRVCATSIHPSRSARI